MKYMGSKDRIANQLLSAMDKYIGGFRLYDHRWWVEPFVGGCNMIDKVGHIFKKRLGNDTNEYLMAMFYGLSMGWVPPDSVSEELYKKCKDELDYFPSVSPALIGFVGVGCSYSGKWFGGYARGNNNNGTPRNYCLESKNNLLKQAPQLNGVIFTSGDYRQMDIPPESIIYCDPPYQGTTKYKDCFNHTEFWGWCDKMSERGHIVFVSEYTAPPGWVCIWEKTINSSLTKNTGSKQGIERLWCRPETMPQL